MAAALEALERLSADPEAQRLAREREDALRLYELSLAHSRREGRAEGHEEGREEGRVETLKETILVLVASIGLELTPEQRARLDDPRTNLVEIRDALIRERRWP